MTIGAYSGKLQSLSNEIKMLVNDGVYSLYTLQGHGSATFILINDRKEFFLLNDVGAVLQKVTSLSGITIGEPVVFPNMRTDSMKVNYA